MQRVYPLHNREPGTPFDRTLATWTRHPMKRAAQ
jgi:hypothetical protein